MKRLDKHTIYEVWCEHTAESVFIDHKPTKKEIEKIRKKEGWTRTDQWGREYKLVVEKLQKIYTRSKWDECNCYGCTVRREAEEAGWEVSSPHDPC